MTTLAVMAACHRARLLALLLLCALLAATDTRSDLGSTANPGHAGWYPRTVQQGTGSRLALRGGEDAMGNLDCGRASTRAGMSARFLPPRRRTAEGKEQGEPAQDVPGPTQYVPGPFLEAVKHPPVRKPADVHNGAVPGPSNKATPFSLRGRSGPSPREQFESLKQGGLGAGNAIRSSNGRPRSHTASASASALDTIRARLMELPADDDNSVSLDSKEERSRDGSGDSVQHDAATRRLGGKRPSPTGGLGTLTSDQERALQAVQAGHSIFLTGSAGTGKSYVLKHLIAALKRRHGNHAVHVTASTGAAAVLIGGTTLHAFAGIGLGKEDAATLVKRVYSNKLTSSRWQRARALIIDEVSMIDCDLFDKIDYVARQLKTPVPYKSPVAAKQPDE
jgi:hypothetical protein